MPADSHPHSPTPEDIMAYLDGETPPASRAIIEAHLAGCQECDMVAESFRRVSQRAAEWAVEPSPVSMRMANAPAARHAPARILAWRSWPPRFVLAGLTAAAAVLLVVSLKEDPRRGPSLSALTDPP